MASGRPRCQLAILKASKWIEPRMAQINEVDEAAQRPLASKRALIESGWS